MQYKVLLNDCYDITDYVIKLPLIKESLITNSNAIDYKASFEINNSSDIINDNSTSIFSDWLCSKYYISLNDCIRRCCIYKGNIEVITGYANKIVEISTRNSQINLTKKITTGIANSSLIEIMYILENHFCINFDHSTWKISNSFINNSRFSISASEESPVQIIELLKLLSETLGLWIYYYNNIVYCVPQSITFLGHKCTIMSDQIISDELSNSYTLLKNDYCIKYGISSQINDNEADNIGLESRNRFGIKAVNTDCTSSNSIIIYDKETAIIVGNNLIKRYLNLFKILNITVNIDIAVELGLLDAIKVQGYGNKFIVTDKEYDYSLSTCKIELWEVI